MKTPEQRSLELMQQWFDSVDHQEFINEFNSLGDHFSGPTIGEFLDEYELYNEDDNEFVNIFTNDDFVFGLEIKNNRDTPSLTEKVSEENGNVTQVSVEKFLFEEGSKYSQIYVASNDSPYFEDDLAEAA